MVPKRKRLDDQIQETREALASAFPLTFARKGEKKRPLKVGIFHEVAIRLPELPRNRLRAALRDYTGGPLYLKAITVGAARLDLDGKPSGSVSESEAAHAAARLNRINTAKARRVRAAGRAAKVRRDSERVLLGAQA